MTSRASAYWEEMWVDENGMTHIVGHTESEGEREVARLVEVRNRKMNQLYAKEQNDYYTLKWLIDTKNSHEAELKAMEERTSANYLEAVRLEASMNRYSDGENIYINNSR